MLLFEGFATAITPINIFFVIVGGVLGIIVGAMPGLGSVAGTALLLPITFKMEPTTAIITLAALYYGNMFGGAISAILLNIPGDSPAVMTALDGHSLAKKGRGGQALFISFTSSLIGGLIGVIILTFVGSGLAKVGLRFGPPEMAAIILLAMTSIGWVLGDSPVKGLLVTVLGLIIASIGVDSMEGTVRMTFGIFNLINGVEFIPLIIGLFGFSQVINTVSSEIPELDAFKVKKLTIKNSIPSKEEWKRSIPSAIRNSFLGFFIGLLPGSGSTTAAFLAYISEKKLSKHPEELGKGAPEGIAASEASNNAGSMGAFAPLLALGIPGSGTAAVLLGGLMMWGLQPGPLLMQNNPEFAWGLIASMYIGNILIAIICILAIPILVSILKVPNSILVPVIIAISVIGSYSVNNSVFDIYIMILGGILGFILMKGNFPLATLTLAVVLGPTLETTIRQSFRMSGGNVSIFFTRPISLTILLAGVALIVLPTIMKFIKKGKKVANN